jgi:hypothetical protein
VDRAILLWAKRTSKHAALGKHDRERFENCKPKYGTEELGAKGKPGFEAEVDVGGADDGAEQAAYEERSGWR